MRNLSLFRVTTTVLPDDRVRCLVELVISRTAVRPGSEGPKGHTVTHTQRFERTMIARNKT